MWPRKTVRLRFEVTTAPQRGKYVKQMIFSFLYGNFEWVNLMTSAAVLIPARITGEYLSLYDVPFQIMAKSRDWEELLYVWSEWRRKSGENIKDMYEQLVDLTNEAANYNSTYAGNMHFITTCNA